MRIGIPKEPRPEENRVAASPDMASRLCSLGYEVLVETQAGEAARFLDEDYRAAGADICDSPTPLWEQADIILKVLPPRPEELDLLRSGQTLIGFLWPARDEALLNTLAEKQVTALAMDCIPRISRAQKVDVLSSMANIAGYRAVIEASWHFGRFFAGQITAAGKIPPAKVLVIGAGVAGLAAIGTANSLGAIVRAFDTRAEVAEQIQSMGAEFLTVDMQEDAGSGDGYAKEMSKEFIEAEMALFMAQAKEVDIIITTALIPGKPAPELITEDMLREMKPGSVLVDLAAEQGGNCRLTEKDEVTVKHGVTLIGYTNLPGRLPTQSSQLYANNLHHLLADMTPEKDGELQVDMDDVVIRSCTVVKDGEITWPPPPVKVSAAPAPKAAAPAAAPAPQPPAQASTTWKLWLTAGIGALVFLFIGMNAPASFLQHFTVFVLACFVGYMVIWNVTASLHTPLMSVTNAVSSIIIIGALVQFTDGGFLQTLLACVAVLITSVNIVGGFAVTQRMLSMFRKRD